jgi:hypothetical protein
MSCCKYSKNKFYSSIHGSIFLVLFFFSISTNAFVLRFSNTDFSADTLFSDVDEFSFEIDIDNELMAGVFNDPIINAVNYTVSGVLESGTPSGFSAFQLVREIDGEDFYLQGSSLWFQISSTANLNDGLDLSELVPNPNGEILIFNGREVGNGRFHPALLVLREDGSGRIQNSNNIPDIAGGEVSIGAEYITDLQFDPQQVAIVSLQNNSGSGGGAMSWWVAMILLMLIVFYSMRKASRYP